ncbi:YigZ family protein [Endozoicomonas sp. YOMI1]|uniref:YigZ family protein n=1 Tax=Endozoicomonas sp. YOMI1 TaxID=2828739 RepID=UPI002149841F|nr:YigZ family protein [Endozoicomonas sp. YOMI1]
MSADYVVPAQVITVETEVRKSRFIACISPAHSRREALAFVEEKRIEYPDATHHCSAFVAGAPDGGAVVGFHGSLEQCDYGQSVKMMILMPETGREHLARHLHDVSRGQIVIQWQDDV